MRLASSCGSCSLAKVYFVFLFRARFLSVFIKSIGRFEFLFVVRESFRLLAVPFSEFSFVFDSRLEEAIVAG
jgi:hypothetical protein